MPRDYYAEYRRLLELWLDEIGACDHSDRHVESEYRHRVYRYCAACAAKFSHLHRAALAEHKRARKTELDAEPRCELCKRRGKVYCGGVLLCGAHWKRCEREFNRRFSCALFAQPRIDAALVREMAGAA